DDVIQGGAGSDLLRGGEGADLFRVVTSALSTTDIDNLQDFTSGTDTITFGANPANVTFEVIDGITFFDINGDGTADYAAKISGGLVASDIV
ncbi:MAG: hypothetical protein AAFY72_16660, partial [Cyanobacteria bacterium J06649_4]